MNIAYQDLIMEFNRKDYDDETLVNLYKNLLRPRLIEEKMLVLLRQGRISKWFSGIGQEAIAVGCTMALNKDDLIFPMHRNLGVFTSRGIDLGQLFAQFQGKNAGFTKGRDRSFHFGTMDYNIVGMISHLGPQLSLANGVALANLLDQKEGVTLAFSGDGATSEGEFHEAMNVAAVWELPVIFVIENNGYGLSTPNSEQYRCEHIKDKGIGYGMEAIQIDGNNLLKVYDTISRIASELRFKPRPIMVEMMTFRMRGHEEASGTKYVPKELFEIWGRKDPVNNYEMYLLNTGILSPTMVQDIKLGIKREIEEGLKFAFAEKAPVAKTEIEVNDVYAPFNNEAILPESATKSEKRFVDAISDGLKQAMFKHHKSVIMGQDVAEYGGVFKITQDFVEIFGKGRVRNTPLCESAIVGAGLGLSLQGYKAIVEMQFADFVTCGFNQIVNNLAKLYYRWGQNADVVIRMPTGAGTAAGPFHSQSNEAWFFHTPGLKIVYPATPYEAKGLLTAAIADPNPVLYFEHKYLYRSIKYVIPDDYYTLEIGKAHIVREGSEVSVITYGMGVHWAKEIIEELHLEEEVEVLNLRTLLPWDKEAVQKTVEKTGKVLILHEDCLTGGIGAEISAWISEHCFTSLDAPVMREGSLDTPVPFAKPLEDNFLPKTRFREKLQKLINF